MASEATPISMEREYEALRAEIERRSAVQQALSVLNLTAVGALITLALKAKLPAGVKGDASLAALNSTRGFFLVLLVPYASFALARLWLDHHEAIGRAGRYIRNALEPRSHASWETHLQASGRSTKANHYAFIAAYVVIFVGPAVLVLAATCSYAGHTSRLLTWIVGVLLTLLNVAGWWRACWPAREYAVSLARLRTMFEPRVRTNLIWQELERAARRTPEKVGVREYFVGDRYNFEGWWMPWYYRVEDGENKKPERVEVKEEMGGYAIRVLDCGALPTRADGDWEPKSESVKPFEAQARKSPWRFDVCVYAFNRDVGGGERPNAWIVLDGNHHLAAALRSGQTFTARVFEIRGPYLEAVLQDLGRDWNAEGTRPGTPQHEQVLAGRRTPPQPD